MPLIGGVISLAVTFLVCGVGALFLYPKYVDPSMDASAKIKLIAVFAGLLAVICGLFLPKWLSAYKINEEGVRRTVLGRTVSFIKWENVAEVRFAMYGSKAWIFISESNLDYYSFKEINKKKDTIGFPCYQKSLLAVREFYKKPIKNYPENYIVG